MRASHINEYDFCAQGGRSPYFNLVDFVTHRILRHIPDIINSKLQVRLLITLIGPLFPPRSIKFDIADISMFEGELSPHTKSRIHHLAIRGYQCTVSLFSTVFIVQVLQLFEWDMYYRLCMTWHAPIWRVAIENLWTRILDQVCQSQVGQFAWVLKRGLFLESFDFVTT